MSNWSKEDRNAFNRSEVFSQMEENLVKNIQKVYELTKSAQNVEQKMNDLSNSIEKANDSAEKLENTLSNFAEDEDIDFDESEEEFSVKAGIISELTKMAEIALSDKNYSDLYRIERAIQELKDDE